MGLRITKGIENAPIEPLHGRTVAVLGFGNQGRAHALNLRDSGIATVVGARADSRGASQAKALGFSVRAIADAAAAGDLVIIALPDEAQPEVYAGAIAPNLRGDATIGFLHGFSIRFGLIKPEESLGVVMVAPKGPGKTLRDRFVQGQGIPCLMAVQQGGARGEAEALALAWANGIGCARAGMIHTTFQAEADSDLFGEQAVLCGGLMQLIRAAFQTLVEAGYPPELAYLECCHEVKQVADLVYARGLAGMTAAISNTAEFGAYSAGPKLVDDSTRRGMAALLEDIRSGRFAERFRRDYKAGFAWFKQQQEELASDPIEAAGRTIRALMPWLEDDREERR